MRVIRWKGRSIKEVKGKRLQSGDNSSRLITTEKSLLLSLPIHTCKQHPLQYLSLKMYVFGHGTSKVNL